MHQFSTILTFPWGIGRWLEGRGGQTYIQCPRTSNAAHGDSSSSRTSASQFEVECEV
ncbi:hypothetical protein BGW80DRAFT_1359714, partial [Lactifluus volemus]